MSMPNWATRLNIRGQLILQELEAEEQLARAAKREFSRL